MTDRRLVSASKWGLRMLFRLLFRIQYVGIENLPKTGPVLIVPNHQTYFDPLFVGAALPRSVRYMAMKKLFRWRPIASLLRFYGAFPVATRSADKGAIKACLQFLKAGEMILIFPEGGRTQDGKLQDFFQGFARIALLQQAPIVPVTISGAHRIWPPTRKLPWLGKVRVTFHPPLHPTHFPLGQQPRPLQITEKVKQTIAAAL
ncbi:MAG: 1-acyl-sn-glycerol-3-phosphate acyltransferase [Acidobacteria bacterium]|nr:1-acyl-sn-glycerol-3-phosphate acyltransferase [Acidobacteriota bacterium]